MAEQAQDEEFNMDFFYSGKVKPPNQDEPILNSPSPDHEALEVMTAVTLLSSPPELYDPSMVSLKSVQSKFILIGWFYLAGIEEIHVEFFVCVPFTLIHFRLLVIYFPVAPSNRK